MNKAHIITIGNELLIGDTVNTNASWIGSFLVETGFEVQRIFTIPDDYEIIKTQIESSLEHAAVTIVTGGLGPTHDDITKKVVADIFDCGLIRNEAVLEHIKKTFERRGFHLSQPNIIQADVPSKSEVLFNKMGTAPGMWFAKNGNYLAVLPGVPYEMKYLMQEEVRPKLQRVFSDLDVWVTDYFKTAGIPESTLSERVGNVDEFVNNGVGVAYLPSAAGVTIRVSANGATAKAAGEKLKTIRASLNHSIGDYLYGKGKSLKLAAVVGAILKDLNLSIAAAESCTGGCLANEITNIPGCSDYMKGGIIAYANDIKTSQLGVKTSLIEKEGAVSKAVALQMAKGVAERFRADVGVSTTGIAGPGGGTEEKPVGLVWMGFWINGTHFALKTIFTNNRQINKERTVMVVLETLRRQLLGINSYPYELKPHRP